MRYRDWLPQLHGSLLANDGGMETWLVFHEGFNLPCFASFPLLETDRGRAALDSYFEPYLALARRHGLGFVLEAATWRANPAWGRKLGYSLGALAEANRRSIAYVEEIRAREETPGCPFPISGAVGPEADAYNPDHRLSAAEAEDFHSWQIGVLAETSADLVTAWTIGYSEEAVGIVRAAVAAAIPAAISFTVETNGRLPSGQRLAEAIEQVDEETDGATAYYLVNCAHPVHLLPVLVEAGPWTRLLGLRANASKKSHAELDESDELDAGDPAELAAGYLAIRERLPHLNRARRLLRHRPPPRHQRRRRLARRVENPTPRRRDLFTDDERRRHLSSSREGCSAISGRRSAPGRRRCASRCLRSPAP